MHIPRIKHLPIKLKLALSLVLAAGCFFPLTAISEEVGLFNSIEFQGKSIKALPRWVRVLEKISEENQILKACNSNFQNCPTPALIAWREFMVKHQAEEIVTHQTLQDLNDFVNQWAYITDMNNWGKSDYWASPLEFMSNSGDCEDYAIMKYVALKGLGVSQSDMRIVVVQDTVRDVAHAVLAVYLEGAKPFIMDSLFDTVLSHDKILQYIPHYSVNETTRWAHIMPIRKKEHDQ